MGKIIYIETSTDLCSTALSIDGKIVSYRESGQPKAHASLTAVFIDEMLRETGLGAGECDAVCVAKGPGSYTGLRVGVSTAKGLCYGAGIRLLSVGTLETLLWQYLADTAMPSHTRDAAENADTRDAETNADLRDAATTASAENALRDNPDTIAHDGTIPYIYIVPVIDARRMEVYTQVFRPNGTAQTEPEAKIIDPQSYADLLAEGPVLFVGDAADKCSKVITHPNARFLQCCPKASSMLVPAERALREGRFEDVAYFEPFYLKNFVATVSKKSLWNLG